MANETNVAGLGQGLVRENWGGEYIAALYEPHAVLPNMSNMTGDFQRGDTANVPVAPVLTVGTTGADGSLNVQTDNHTNIAVIVDKVKDVTVELIGIARLQAEKAFEENFPSQAGDAARQQMEADGLGLWSDLTTTAIADGTGQLGEDDFLVAIQSAITAKLPIMEKPNEFCFALADTCFAPTRKLNILDYNKTGEAGVGGASSIALPSLYNIPVKFSTQVATSSGIRKNMLFHKSAFAWAAQREPSPEMVFRLAAAKYSWLMTVLAVYGVKTVVTTRGWVLNSKA